VAGCLLARRQVTGGRFAGAVKYEKLNMETLCFWKSAGSAYKFLGIPKNFSKKQQLSRIVENCLFNQGMRQKRDLRFRVFIDFFKTDFGEMTGAKALIGP
jgi:hypothetical protein